MARWKPQCMANAAVDAIMRWAHCGPQHAQVERVDIATDDGSYTGFEVMG